MHPKRKTPKIGANRKKTTQPEPNQMADSGEETVGPEPEEYQNDFENEGGDEEDDCEEKEGQTRDDEESLGEPIPTDEADEAEDLGKTKSEPVVPPLPKAREEPAKPKAEQPPPQKQLDAGGQARWAHKIAPNPAQRSSKKPSRASDPGAVSKASKLVALAAGKAGGGGGGGRGRRHSAVTGDQAVAGTDMILMRHKHKDELVAREQHIKQLQEEIRTLKKVQRMQDKALKETESEQSVGKIARLSEEQRVLAEELKAHHAKRRELEQALRDARSQTARLSEECDRLREIESPGAAAQRKAAEQQLPELEKAKRELEHKIEVMAKIKEQDDSRLMKLAKENKRLKDQVTMVEEELRETQARLQAATASVARKQRLAAGAPAMTQPQPELSQQLLPPPPAALVQALGPPKPKAKKVQKKPEELPSPVMPDTPPSEVAPRPLQKLPSPRELEAKVKQDPRVSPDEDSPKNQQVPILQLLSMPKPPPQPVPAPVIAMTSGPVVSEPPKAPENPAPSESSQAPHQDPPVVEKKKSFSFPKPVITAKQEPAQPPLGSLLDAPAASAMTSEPHLKPLAEIGPIPSKPKSTSMPMPPASTPTTTTTVTPTIAFLPKDRSPPKGTGAATWLAPSKKVDRVSDDIFADL